MGPKGMAVVCSVAFALGACGGGDEAAPPSNGDSGSDAAAGGGGTAGTATGGTAGTATGGTAGTATGGTGNVAGAAGASGSGGAAGADSGVPDASLDAPADAPVDAPSDASLDAPADAPPDAPPDVLVVEAGPPTWMAYRADVTVDSQYELYAVNVAGGTQSPLKLNSALGVNQDVSSFEWSPDGQRIVYLADQDTDGTDELYLVDMSGAAPGAPAKLNAALATGGDVSAYAWSADGAKVAYRADQDTDGVLELYVVDVALTVPQAPVKVSGTMVTGGDVFSFAWSPAGDQLAYLADQDQNGTDELYVLDAAASPTAPQKVNGALVSLGNVLGFAWSPDASFLGYIADQTLDGQDELFVAAVTGGAPNAATQVNAALTDPQMDVLSFVFSPDSTRLLFRADQDTALTDELYLVTLTGTGPTAPVKVNPTLAAGGNVAGLAWSPDGNTVSYPADQDTQGVTELYMVDVSAAAPGAAVKISGSMVANGDVSGPHLWSSDSKWIAYRADQDSDTVNELYAVDVTAAVPAPVKVSGTMVLNGDVGSTSYSWSPDGKGLVYIADQEANAVDEIYFVSFASTTPSAPQKLNGSVASGGDVQNWQWHQSSSFIAFKSDHAVDTVDELWFGAVAGGVVSTVQRAHPPFASSADVLTWAWRP